jgi:HEAT repeat protein
VLGTHRVEAAIPVLSAMVIGDEDVMARQAAAWALGRIGTTASFDALRSAQADAASTPRVRDAIEVALRMR